MLAQMPRQGDLTLSLFEEDGGGALGERHGVSTGTRQSHHNHEGAPAYTLRASARSRRSASREGGKARWHDGKSLLRGWNPLKSAKFQSAIYNLQSAIGYRHAGQASDRRHRRVDR